MHIIGWDSAVQEENIGLLHCTFDARDIVVVDLWDGSCSAVEQIAQWLRGGEPVLVGVDSPLGWPQPFSDRLALHYAGVEIGTDDTTFFRRITDVDIARRLGKTPLEVSADRIARTAFFTLKRIHEIRRDSGREVGLVWSPEASFDVGFIEVYPASTLIARGLSIRGYKQRGGKRAELYRSLQEIYGIRNESSIDLVSREHDFDALVCCLACADFLDGSAVGPAEMDYRIRKEGWIWTRRGPASNS